MIVPPYNTSIGALGVALQALDSVREDRVNPEVLKATGSICHVSVPVASRLSLKKTIFPENNEVHLIALNKENQSVPRY